MDQLSIGEARRIALAAQGFTEKRPSGKVGRRQLQKVVDRLQVVQLDSVNVAVRSHYMPFFSRLGPYPLAELDAARVGHASPLRVLGAPGVAPPGGAAPVASLEDGAAPPRSAVAVAQRAREEAPGLHRRGARGSPWAGPARGRGAHRSRQEDGAVVGLQQGQADARVPVLDGPGHGQSPGELRAGVRRARAGDPCRRARRADTGRARRPQGAPGDQRGGRSRSERSATSRTTSC